MNTNVSKALTKRQRQGRDTKRKLLDVTKTLLGEKSFNSVTLDKIADNVGVTKTSILWHFGSKEDLLIAAVFDLFEDLEAAVLIEKSTHPDFGDRFSYLLDAVANS